MPVALAVHADLVVGVCLIVALAIVIHAWRWAADKPDVDLLTLIDPDELCIGRPLFAAWDEDVDELEAMWRRSA